MAAAIVAAIDQQTANAGGAHFGEGDLLAGERRHALLKRDLGRSATGPKAYPNGDQVNWISELALKRGKSVDFTGYWQRHLEA